MYSRVFDTLLRNLTLSLGLLAALPVVAQEELRATLFGAAEAKLEEARSANAELLSPANFEQAMDRYVEAVEDFDRGRNIDRIRFDLSELVSLLDQAIESSEIAEITLASLIKTRDDALNAESPTFAAELWFEAQEMFDEAARRLETGNIRQARQRSDEAEALFRDAELNAIKAQYLSQTLAFLADAERAGAEEYAPRTYERARALLQQAETELNDNRYDTDLPRSLAQQANYEAQHAIYLAELIEMVDDDLMTVEDVVLQYEEPLTQIAAAADLVAELHQGADEITSELILLIEQLREERAQSGIDLSDARVRIAELEEEIRELDEQLGGISQERIALVQRLEAEARIRDQFAMIESLFDREEARVTREGNNLVLRLVGLTFESGSAEVTLDNRDLLGKVAQAANVFPRSQIVVEGHTDSYGSDDNNMELSRQRADAVRSFLSNQLGIEAFRTSAVGYGETQPIANNETPQGRARNRRIDVRIEPQLQ